MILLTAAAWYYLAVYGGNPPFGGPLTKGDCMMLRQARVSASLPQGACLRVMAPKKRAGAP